MRTDQSIALDHYLVTVARMGDNSALARLAQRWQPKLLKHAQRLLGEEELAREARAFPAWALRIVSRRCAGSIRQRQGRRQQDVAETFDNVASTTASPEQSAAAAALEIATGTVKTRLMHARHRMRVLLQGE